MTDWTTDSNEALQIHLVRANEDDVLLPASKKKLSDVFHPKFTYPIFGEEEKIYGYKNLSIKFSMASGSLRQFVSVEQTARLTGTAIDDPENTLYQYLSDDRIKTKEEFIKRVEEDAKTFKPMGTKIYSYVRSQGSGKQPSKDPRDTTIGKLKERNGGGDAHSRHIDEESPDAVVYEVYHANWSTPGFLEYHRRMQIFILLYIEAGSYIQEDEEKWEFVTLFERRKRRDGTQVYHFVGYSSLYPFYFYPASTRLRLSQFVIVGPYQKQGHGSALYKAIHDFVLSSSRFAELTVEDPSEDFEDLRDKVDLRTLLNHKEFVQEAYGVSQVGQPVRLRRGGREGLSSNTDAKDESKGEARSGGGKVGSKAMLGPPTKSKWAERWRKELKFAKRQYDRLIEILVLRALDPEDEATQRAFRLQVKARLKTFNFETLMQLEQDEQYDKLEETFQSVKEGYERVLNMLK
ncbi:histone acetyltransferase 1 [Serendipita sp. 396]|nr:histone acetyltransferase 1 [Serendipita sp. 396]KAG8786610.1 histone acetyltransferase 1 [Serendipita sp. 397]KAG8801923.1 histone acetyltransferase 1 [Serendipita sp. 398]KAG8836791.1 histone acetyltransferase 1 [Serendipita sp. 400]KAG8870995.1 histone acetyltransferase 1 [Serendipita sp. 405]